MAPSVRSVGTASAGGTTSPHSVNTPASVVSGDLLICLLEVGSASAVSATGWTEASRISQTAPAGSTVLEVMTRIADGSEGASVSFTITGTINHVHGQMIAIQNHGLATVSDIVNGTPTSGAAGTSPSTGGITVTADSMIVICGTSSLDAATTTEFSGFTNSNLTSITEQMDDGILTGNGGAFGMATGICAGTSVGTTTWSLGSGTTEAWTGVQLGIAPAAGAAAYSSMSNKRLGSQQLHRATNYTNH